MIRTQQFTGVNAMEKYIRDYNIKREDIRKIEAPTWCMIVLVYDDVNELEDDRSIFQQLIGVRRKKVQRK